MNVVDNAALAAPPLSAAAEEFVLRLPIAMVRESERNARRYFDPRKMAELIDSVKRYGVIQPVLVRRVGDHWELIDGARRRRAAIAAELDYIAAQVFEGCSDQEAMELGAISNLQRADIHPLDEALAYRALIEASGAEVATVAARVGMSESYVYQRLKLTDLCELAQQMLWEERITLSAAILLARLQPADQARATRTNWAMASQRTLADWIEREVMLDLHSAPWKKDDAELLPAAGNCHDCTKRTGASPMLFPEVQKKDTCTDPACFKAKRVAFVERQKVKLAEREPDIIHVNGSYLYGQKSELLDASKYNKVSAEQAKEDPRVKKALVVEGDGAGRVIYIAPTGSGGGLKKSDADKAADKKAKLEDKIRRETASRSVAAILAKVDCEISLVQWRFIVGRMWERAWNDLRMLILRRRGVEGSASEKAQYMEGWLAKASSDDLARLLVELALGAYGDYRQEPMQEMANIVGVHLKEVADEVRAELVDGKKPAPKKEAAAPLTPAPETNPFLSAAARKQVVQAKKKLAAKKVKVPPAKKATKKATKKAAKKKRT